MKPIFNQHVQVVSENYLRAVLHRISGFAHRYWIERMSSAYCTVAYSNPDEYGMECPVLLRFPLFRGFDGHPLIALFPGTASHGRDPDDREATAEQMYLTITEVPDLFRSPADGEWHTKEEWENDEPVVEKPIGQITHNTDPEWERE